MEIFEIIKEFGFPVACCFVLFYALRELFVFITSDIKSDIDNLRDIIVKLIETNQVVREDVKSNRSDLSTMIEFLKNGKK